ncbi:TPA: hypothetical protein DE059_00635, partial [Candidatus Peribacteria bacterium]|nr:hypothetical protein [Candidatus Peribacteria bacterium]
MKNSTLASYVVIAVLVSGIGLIQSFNKTDTFVATSLSFPFGNGNDCQNIKCENGREFPRCDNGNPINYFADPCRNPASDTECGNGKCE